MKQKYCKNLCGKFRFGVYFLFIPFHLESVMPEVAKDVI